MILFLQAWHTSYSVTCTYCNCVALTASKDAFKLPSLSYLLTVENVELTSNKERQFTCPGDQVIFTCQILGSTSLEWRSLLIAQPVTYRTDDRPPETLHRGSFTASLVSVSGLLWMLTSLPRYKWLHLGCSWATKQPLCALTVLWRVK